MKIIHIIFIILIWSSVYADSLRPMLKNGQTTNHYAVKIFYNTEDLRLKIITTFHPLESNENQKYIVVEVNEEEHQKLLDLDLDLKITIDKNFTEKINNVSSTVKFKKFKVKSAKKVNKQIYKTIPDFYCYRTVEGTFATAEDIVKKYPNLAQWIDVGDSWQKENGQGGYDMKVLKLTNLSKTQAKPALFITSSIHAREYTPAELATRFAEYLVNNYGRNADITWMLDHHEVHLMLMANPDGRKYAEQGLSWRKNTNDTLCANQNTVYGNGPGIDLNRNFDFLWDCCGGGSQDPCSVIYNGTAPASEPETQAIQAYMKNLFGDHRASELSSLAPLDISGIYLDIHSFGKLVLWPWDMTHDSAPNNLVTLGRKLAFTNGHVPKQAIGLYPTDGTTKDYAYGELGIPGYTIELGSKFFQECSIFNDTIVPDNIPSLLYALKAVRRPYTLPLGPEVVDMRLNTGNISVPKGTTVTLTAIANDTRYNNSNGVETTQNILQAEYYIDTPYWMSGAKAIPMNPQDGVYNNSIESITTIIDTTSLTEGRHTIFVRAKDTDANWGVVSAIFITVTPPSQTTMQTLYEDAQDGKTTGWRVYDNTPAGAKIYNVYDTERKSRVIELKGVGTQNGFILGGFYQNNNSWKNRTQNVISWDMKTKENFVVYISLHTKKGHRYIYYTSSTSNKGKSGQYIHYGLNSVSKDGKWHNYSRNLSKDLKQYESDNSIISVDGFLIRGNGSRIDDISTSIEINP